MYREAWETLSKINVNEHTQDKNGLTFLSWAWAWGTLMEHYPESTYEFREPVKIGDTVEVWVTVAIREGDKQAVREMWLPVMDFRNKSISNPTSRDISDTRMRCLTKCLSIFGLGFYLYAGEDIPQAEQNETITEDQIASISELLTDEIESKFLSWVGVETVSEIKNADYNRVYGALKKRANN